MGPELAARLYRFLVGCHPPRWRQRYAAELLEVLNQHRPTSRTVLNLCASAVSAHLDPAWQAGWHPTIRLRRWAWIAAPSVPGLLAVWLRRDGHGLRQWPGRRRRGPGGAAGHGDSPGLCGRCPAPVRWRRTLMPRVPGRRTPLGG